MRSLILGLICFVSFSSYASDPSQKVVQASAEVITIKSMIGTSLQGYVAGPEDATLGILILHDRWGINSTIRQWVDRFAARGYRALAIDVFDGRISKKMRLATEIMNATDPEWVKADIKAGLGYLKKDGRKLVTLGAGFGGWQSFQAALAEPDGVAGTVMIYGELEADVAQIRTLKAPLLAIFARQDDSITLSMIENYRLLVKKSLILYKSYIFAAGHGFMDPAYPNYDESQASDAWAQVDSFLADFVETG